MPLLRFYQAEEEYSRYTLIISMKEAIRSSTGRYSTFPTLSFTRALNFSA